MSKQKSVTEQAGADDTSIGFDYQYYYFLYRLLNLKTGESVGLEVKDDVHTELDNDFQLLFQLKHTVQNSASGAAIALSELDSDLWKTLHNWAKIICDPVDGRAENTAQMTFVKKTEFHLVTNKTESKSNDFLRLVEQLRVNEIGLATLKAHMQGLQTKSTNQTIQGYIAALLALSDKVLEEFSRRIFVELDEDDVIGLVKRAIHEKLIDEPKIDSVFERLDSNIRSDNFIAIKKGKRIVISYEDFFTRYRRVFSDARSAILSSPKFEPVLPEDIFSQVFIKRLLEINDFEPGDMESAVDYTIQKMKILRYFEQWIQSGELVVDEIDALHKEVILRWTNEFKGAFRRCSTCQEVVDKALEILKELRRQRFKVSVSELSLELSHGELYHLSDESKIGWHRDWESL